MDPKMLATVAAAGGGGAAPQSSGGDIANQLMELVAPILASPKGQMMAQAIMQQMGGPQGIAQMLGGGGGGPPSNMGPRTMNGLEQMGGRGGQPDMEMLTQGGGASGPNGPEAASEMDMIRDYMAGQKQGAMTTEQELDDVSNKMGVSPDDFPTPEEIKALNSGKITPEQFDAKWGKGAAKEMMETEEDDGGDHDYDD